MKFPEGMEMANQALADFYLSNNLEEEGVALYEEVINSMEMRNGFHPEIFNQPVLFQK